MREQVLTIKQMEELIALGIDTSNASMYYCGGSSAHYKLLPKTGNGKLHPGSIPTFTFYDIVHKILPHVIFNDELIPFELTIKKCGIYYRNNDGNDLIGIVQRPDEETLIDCAYYVLKNMLENKLISNSNK